jgi:hypothetical protein
MCRQWTADKWDLMSGEQLLYRVVFDLIKRGIELLLPAGWAEHSLHYPGRRIMIQYKGGVLIMRLILRNPCMHHNENG